MSTKYTKLYFDDPEVGDDESGESTVPANIITSADVDPVVSIDHINRLTQNISTLQRALGVTRMTPMAAGSVIKRYKHTVTKAAAQVGEGEEIPLSKVARKELTPITLALKKYRKMTTAEAIQKTGRAIALNGTDDALIKEIQKDVRNDFFTMITDDTSATAAAGGNTLQKAVAQAWATLSVYFQDKDVTPIYFVHPIDVATWLGNATITNQTAFGFDYVENFLGMGNAFVSPSVTQGAIFATAQENLNGAYVPASGDVASAFGLTYDESGLVGMTHNAETSRASIETLIMSGIVFYPEDAAGVVKSAITTE